MGEKAFDIGKETAARVSRSLPEETTEAIRARVGERQFSASAGAMERELRGQLLDEYLADYESRQGPVSEQARHRARLVFDEVFAEESTDSGYLAEAERAEAERAERRRLLREELDRYQAEYGTFTDEEMTEARVLLHGTDETDRSV
ncbi:hypothetical protein O7632_27420 [Solwaraspora sp. WMMD406]|uniref:hypothetical protein n=1 Tax=Solwaraspora sp. WMMD406 TaxID=3016095 RepID=UPI0024172F9A|nr:hypothetical protein [Solwaraspora sp. WMMD406]MDG4767795.1 hypothetical protein [Solwaraspora sp. WMMD406]